MKTQTRYNKIIKDAKQDVVIHVKPQDIKGAKCRDHQKCVVAKAIMRQQRSSTKWVDVGNSVVLVGTGKNTGRRYLLRRRAQEQVRFFDENDGRFAPCSVELIAPRTGTGQLARKLGSRVGEANIGGNTRGPNKRQPTR